MTRPARYVLVVAALVWMCWPSVVLAHTEIVQTEPADPCALRPLSPVAPTTSACVNGTVQAVAPSVVRIWFSQPVRPFGGGIRVVGPSGRRVDQGTVQIDGAQLSVPVAAVERGTYLVRWTVLAEDTHPARGSFTFNVGLVTPQPSSSVEIGNVAPLGLVLQTLARWLHLGGYAWGFGVVAFQVLVWRGDLATDSVRRRMRRLIHAGIAMMLVAAPLALLGQTGSFGAETLLDPAAVSDALDASFGRVLGLRLGAAMLLWVLLGSERRAAQVVALVVAVTTALLEAVSTHAASVEPRWIAVLVSALHMMAMALWVGGLAALLAVWHSGERVDRRALLRRFGGVAALSVGMLALTGGIMAWQQQVRLATLLATPYGATLVVKSALVLAVVVLAAWVLRLPDARRARGWTVELGALIVVVGLAGLLLSLPPPR